jgi:hypothetical protein
MAILRTALVGGCAAALLTLSTAATGAAYSTVATGASAPAGSPTALESSPAQLARANTSVRFLNFDSTRGYGSVVTIRGQVVVPGQGSIKNARVKLFRQIDGTKRWQYLQVTRTGSSKYPRFTFTARAVANAQYRAKFVGNANYQPARAGTPVSVYRLFHAALEDGTGRFHGRVTPDYGSRRIDLHKRSCATCGWHRVRSAQTGGKGGFSFTVGAPQKGRWFWRVSTPASTRYIHSHSGVFTTRLR